MVLEKPTLSKPLEGPYVPRSKSVANYIFELVNSMFSYPEAVFLVYVRKWC